MSPILKFLPSQHLRNSLYDPHDLSKVNQHQHTARLVFLLCALCISDYFFGGIVYCRSKIERT